MVIVLRNIVAIITGLIAGVTIIFLVELLGHEMFPPPEKIDLSNPEIVERMIEIAPIGALLMVVLAYILGSFAAGAMAALIPGRSKIFRSFVVGTILMISAVFNLAMYPHPVWFWVLSLIVFVPFSYLGGQLVTGRPSS